MIKKKLIEEKLKELKKERGTIREFSVFGDNNWGTLDKEIEILQKCLTDKSFDPDKELDKMRGYYDGNFPEGQIEKSKMDALDFVVGNIDEL